MKKYFTYREDGTVITVSDGRNKVAEHLTCGQFTVDDEKERGNWNRKIVNGKLVYEKPAQVANAERRASLEAAKNEARNATTLEGVKAAVEKIITSLCP